MAKGRDKGGSHKEGKRSTVSDGRPKVMLSDAEMEEVFEMSDFREHIDEQVDELKNNLKLNFNVRMNPRLIEK